MLQCISPEPVRVVCWVEHTIPIGRNVYVFTRAVLDEGQFHMTRRNRADV